MRGILPMTMRSTLRPHAFPISRLVIAAGLVSAASMALAQPAGRFDQPLQRDKDARAQARAEGQPSSSTRIEMSQSDGRNTYKVSIIDDQVSAKINGESVPDDRIRRTDDKIELLDKDGNTVATFHVGQTDEGEGRRQVERRWGLRAPEAPLAPAAPPMPGAVATATPPKAMAGITLADVPESLAEHLDLKPGEGVMLERVVEGLPADNAGLQAKDIIIEADGTKPLSQDKLREILRSKDAGDKVAIKALRKGKIIEVVLELQRWDGEKLGLGALPQAQFGERGQNWAMRLNPDQMPQGAMREQELKRLQELIEKNRAEAFNAEEMQRHMAEGLKLFEGHDGQRMLMDINPDQWEMFTPRDPEAMKRVETRLQALEERLNALNLRLEKLTNLLEKQAQNQGGGQGGGR
jgi:PDZ domain